MAPLTISNKEEQKDTNLVKSEIAYTGPEPMKIAETKTTLQVSDPDIPKSMSIIDSGFNPFSEDMAKTESIDKEDKTPEIKFEYIIPVRTTFRMKNPEYKIRETIEFAAAILDLTQSKVIGTFQRFVKPRFSPKLTEKEMTMLRTTQEQIDSAKTLDIVLDEFDDFLKANVFFLLYLKFYKREYFQNNLL